MRVKNTELSESARTALDRAHRDGGYVAAGTSVHAGRVERTNAGTLRALAKRGLVTLVTNPDGGVGAWLTPDGTALATWRASRGCTVYTVGGKTS